jgi:hypothetical protein
VRPLGIRAGSGADISTSALRPAVFGVKSIVNIVADIGALFQDEQDGVAGPVWSEERPNKANAKPVASP